MQENRYQSTTRKRNIAMKLREKGMKNLEVSRYQLEYTIVQYLNGIQNIKKDKKPNCCNKRGRVKGINQKISEEQESKFLFF